MKINKSLLLILCCAFFFTSCGQKEVSGEVFVVTQGAGNYKLSLVKITAIPEETIKPLIESYKLESKKASDSFSANFEMAMKKLNEAELELENLEKNYKTPAGLTSQEMNIALAELDLARSKVHLAKQNWHKTFSDSVSINNFFDEIPQGVVTTITNSDGKFTLKLPKSGKYALAAQAQRNNTEETEIYYWLIWIDTTKDDLQNVILSNNNLTRSGSPVHLIETADK